MNGRTEDSSGAQDNKNTRMCYECRASDDGKGIWMNFYEGPGSYSCASFYWSMPEIHGLIATLEAVERQVEMDLMFKRDKERLKVELRAKNNRSLDDYE